MHTAKEELLEMVRIADTDTPATRMMDLHQQELDRIRAEQEERDAAHREHLENALANCWDLRIALRRMKFWHFVALFVEGCILMAIWSGK